MGKPETKVVLGRRFTFHTALRQWFCYLKHGKLVLTCDDGKQPHVSFEIAHATVVAFGVGPTEADAILALQSQLRKMAELEVAE